MAIDPRQVLAGVLTVTMFVMLGHMIKREHFDSVQVDTYIHFNYVLLLLCSSFLWIIISVRFVLI